MGRDSNYLRIGAVSTHSRPQPDHAEAAIRQEGESLGPWHLEVEVTPTLTPEALRGQTIDRIKGFYDPAPGFKGILERLFPAGLEGRSVLDCACNNGAFLYAAKELGAGRCLGTRGSPPSPREAHRRVRRALPAEREGFEPSRQGIAPPTRFPVALLKPLGHLSGSALATQIAAATPAARA